MWEQLQKTFERQSQSCGQVSQGDEVRVGLLPTFGDSIPDASQSPELDSNASPALQRYCQHEHTLSATNFIIPTEILAHRHMFQDFD